MQYIKLGPIGDYFASDRLGVYLNESNAAAVEDSILYNNLKNFLLTGFIIRIDKLEYDNIKIEQRTFNNFPLVVVGTHPILIIEPVHSLINTPPENPVKTQRHIILASATGQWAGRKDYITEFDGTKWVYTEPKDGMIVPVYALGISVHYIGTYPSGYWDINEDRIGELEDIIIGDGDDPDNPTPPDENWATQEWVLQLIEAEREARSLADQVLLDLINSIEFEQNNPTAAQVSIEDTANNFVGTNVELALAELAVRLRDLEYDYQVIQNTILTMQQQIQDILDQLNNDNGPAKTTQLIIFNQVDQINWDHNLNTIPFWALYEVLNPETVESNPDPLPSSTNLAGVMAQPDLINTTSIAFTFTDTYTLVLALSTP